MIFERMKPVDGIEPVPLASRRRPDVAHDIVAAIAVPGFDNSAVDGYAVRFDDLDPAAPLSCAASTASPPAMTRQARCAPAAPRVSSPALPCRRCGRRDHAGGLPGRRRPGDHPARHQARRQHPSRRRGRRRGAVALTAGRRLGSAEIGLLAALGFARRTGATQTVGCLAVDRRRGARARRAICRATRSYDAIASCWRACWSGWRRGARSRHRRRRCGGLGEALRQAAAESDLIVTSGGVSTGEEDHVRSAIANHGSLYFWRLAIKPGRPVAMGRSAATPLAGCPAIRRCFADLRPGGTAMIEALSGSTPHVARRFRVVSDFAYKKKLGRREYVRASLDPGIGLAKARRYHKEGAGMLTSLTRPMGWWSCRRTRPRCNRAPRSTSCPTAS